MTLPKLPRWLSLAWRPMVSAVILALAVGWLDWDSLRHTLTTIDLTVIIGAVGIISLEFLILGWRWHLLIQDLSPQPLGRRLLSYFKALFYSTFTPAQIGTDVYRFIEVKRDGVDKLRIITRLLQERVLGLAGYLLFFLVCALVAIPAISEGGTRTALLAISALFLATIIGIFGAKWILGMACHICVVLGWSKLFWLADKGRKLGDFGTLRQTLVLLALSVTGGTIVWTAAVALVFTHISGEPPPLAKIGMVVVLVELARLAPFTVQGLGVREATFSYLFAALGLQAELGFTVGMVSYLCVSLAVLMIGVLGYTLTWISPAAETETSGE